MREATRRDPRLPWSRTAAGAIRTPWWSAAGYHSQVDAAGATDIEPSGGTVGITKAWLDGCDASGGSIYYNFGSADGCPTSGANATPDSCAGNWDQSDLWRISWGLSPAFAVPEIYAANLSKQWQQISKYGTLGEGSRIIFRGSLTQKGACNQSGCGSFDYTAAEGWNQFHDDLNGATATELHPTPLRFSADMRWH